MSFDPQQKENMNDDEFVITEKHLKLYKKLNDQLAQQIDEKKISEAHLTHMKVLHQNAQTNEDEIIVIDVEKIENPLKRGTSEYRKSEKLIEFAAVKLNLRTGAIKPVGHELIHPESYSTYPSNWEKSWIFHPQPDGGGMDINIIKKYACSFKHVIQNIRCILEGNNVTSFGTKFDLIDLLLVEPYNCDIKNKYTVQFQCINNLVRKYGLSGKDSKLCNATRHFWGKNYAYNAHSAMDDAKVAAQLLYHIESTTQHKLMDLNKSYFYSRK